MQIKPGTFYKIKGTDITVFVESDGWIQDMRYGYNDSSMPTELVPVNRYDYAVCDPGIFVRPDFRFVVPVELLE